MNLIKKFKVKVVKYNLGEPLCSEFITLDNPPSEEEIISFYDEIQLLYPHFKDYHTTIHVEEYYLINK